MCVCVYVCVCACARARACVRASTCRYIIYTYILCMCVRGCFSERGDALTMMVIY